MRKMTRKEIKEWSKNIAEAYENGHSIYLCLKEAAKMLELDWKKVERAYQFIRFREYDAETVEEILMKGIVGE